MTPPGKDGPQDDPIAPASRRTVLAAGLAAVGSATVGTAATRFLPAHAASKPTPAQLATDAPATGSTLSFTEIAHGLDTGIAVSPGHSVQVLLRWGDPVTKAAPAWTPDTQSAAAQRGQFGYDNDFIAFMPLPYGSRSSTSGLLCVNHESTRNHLMFPGFTGRKRDDLDKELVDIEMAAHGHTVVAITDVNGQWSVDLSSGFNRRITATTMLEISGPAAGHARMKTRDDPAGRKVLGTLANCAGGETPWGTVLTAEENIHHFFAGDPRNTPEAANHLAMGISGERYYGWHTYYPRFNVELEPNEPNRFGWIVEIDPYDATVPPVKRTALGRCKHEGAAVVTNHDGRVVCYMGDDEVFQFIYKFVSLRPFDPAERGRNWGLLDEGTLSVARFNGDRTLTWLPMVWGTGPLTPENGFHSQADVLIETRRAAKLLGATPMDRAEDMEVSRLTGGIFVALTKNSRRRMEEIDTANPRPRNVHGSILELLPPGAPGPEADHAAATFRWQPFLLAGDPRDPAMQAQYNPGVSANGWLSCPDNLAFDTRGRLWISTDGANNFNYGDGLWASDVVGPGRALTRHFFRCPIGGETTGPTFTPDGTTLFCSVQHPGDEGDSSFVKPITRWPDFKDGIPPRPSVVAIRAKDGRPIG